MAVPVAGARVFGSAAVPTSGAVPSVAVLPCCVSTKTTVPVGAAPLLPVAIVAVSVTGWVEVAVAGPVTVIVVLACVMAMASAADVLAV